MDSPYHVATTTAGFTPLSRWTTVEVTGRDRATFLHNMCTNDVRGLEPGQGCEAFFTDVKGKIIGHAFLLAGDESVLVITVPDQAARLITHLDRYIIREDVRLADNSAELVWTLAIGPQAEAMLAGLAGGRTANSSTGWSHARRPMGESQVVIARCELPWCGGWLIGAPTAVAEGFRSELEGQGAVGCDDDVWRTVRIESGWPLLGVDFDGTNLPQEVARNQQAISFRKGCYLGQETVARIDAIGHVNRELVTVRFSAGEPPAAGAELQSAGEVAGRVTSVCWSPAFAAPLALAMIRRGKTESGVELTCGEQVAEVVRTPAVGRR